MNSSNQIENIPPAASSMTPAVINQCSAHPAQLLIATEQAFFEIISTFDRAAQTCPVRAWYRVYRTNCNQTHCRPVSLSTFYRRLRCHPARQPHLSPFLAAAQIDETILDLHVCGGSSS